MFPLKDPTVKIKSLLISIAPMPRRVCALGVYFVEATDILIKTNYASLRLCEWESIGINGRFERDYWQKPRGTTGVEVMFFII